MSCPHPHRPIQKRGGYQPSAEGPPPTKPPPKRADASRSAVPPPPPDFLFGIGRPETTHVYWEARLWRWLKNAWNRSPLYETCSTCGYVLPVHHPSCPDR